MVTLIINPLFRCQSLHFELSVFVDNYVKIDRFLLTFIFQVCILCLSRFAII